MATARAILRTLPKSLASTSHFALHSSPQAALAGPSRCSTIIVRSQSSWVAPSKRGRQYGNNNNTANRPARSLVNWNGQSVATHIRDLDASKTFARTKSSNNNKQNVVKPIKEYDSDLIVVLDMDECLIHSQFLQGPGAKFAHQVRRTNGGPLGETSVDTFNISLPDGELVRVHERPHLHDFLAKVSAKYETHVFTAAMEVYAKPVLDVLDPKGEIFTHIWYRESCTMDSAVGAYVKDLDFQWGDRLQRTVLVDNNPMSFLANPSNGILVSSFYNDPSDTTLPAVFDLLEELDEQDDVRPTLDSRFGLKEALSELQSGRKKSFSRKTSSISSPPPQHQQQMPPSPRQQQQVLAAAAAS